MADERMWGGRFSEQPDALLVRVNASISFDKRLVFEDVLGSIAHSRMLKAVGLISEDIQSKIEGGLLEVLARFADGKVELKDSLEDIHTHVEQDLRATAGAEAAGQLHTGRSRNDQVALDLALWLRSAVGGLRSAVLDTIETLLDKAEEGRTVLVPGVTHLQAAQPITVGYQLLAYVMPLLRDEERLTGLRGRLRYCPLGSGSLAGSPLPLDRNHVAESLGFEGGPSLNGMDSVAARDLAAEICQVAALTGVDLSRLAEDMILWASPGYGYISLPDACCTGSSLMPQKKNPDGLELVRGKSARLIAHATALTTLMKGLPMAYNKDLQEDKEAVFDAVDSLLDMLALTRLSLSGVSIDKARCAAAVQAHSAMMATDLADYLVHKGLPFRSAHEVAGQIVADAENSGMQLSEMSLKKMQERDGRFESDIYEWLDPEQSVAKRKVFGGPAPEEVARVIASLRAELVARRTKIASEHKAFPLLEELEKSGRLPG